MVVGPALFTKNRKMSDLEYENLQVLCLVQASIGGISPNMRVVSLIRQGKAAVLRFLLEEESQEDREDIVFAYFALRSDSEEGEAHASVDIIGKRELIQEDIVGRAIYIRKEKR